MERNRCMQDVVCLVLIWMYKTSQLNDDFFTQLKGNSVIDLHLLNLIELPKRRGLLLSMKPEGAMHSFQMSALNISFGCYIRSEDLVMMVT